VQVLGFIWGILAMVGMFIAFIPLLGWLNWANIPFAIIGLIISIVGTARAQDSNFLGIAGIVMCLMAIIWGALRLKAGRGIL
jgi:hypothetical protein